VSDDPIELLAQLVRIPSVNPMGRVVSDGAGHGVEGSIWREGRLTAFLRERLSGGAFRIDVQEVEPERSNLLVTLPAATPPGEGGRWLVWDVHQDTVPIDGMVVPPFEGVRENGRLYGRGACDVKGSMAAMLVALERLREVPAGRRPTVTLVLSVNEEFGFTGARAAAAKLTRGEIYAARPDAAIVAEPTEFQVVVTHKGVVRWRIETRGKACHSSSPDQGDNAIYRMARVLGGLDEYARTVVGTLGHEPLLGSPTLSVGTIGGGVSVNTVPDFCTIDVDRRMAPEEDPAAAIAHVAQWLQGKGLSDGVTHGEQLMSSRGLKAAGGERLAESVLTATHDAGFSASTTIGVPYGTDAPAYSCLGIPAVVWGPGSIAQAHTKDEWIDEAAVHAYVDLLVEHAVRFAEA
jgi:acetylornithine deacetylase